MNNSPGRVCPLHYRYAPEVFDRAPELHGDTLLIAGGLYGNRAALDALHRQLEADATLVFNGDFNWFNIDASGFETINTAVLQHHALRGNVETELAAAGTGAGCGCAYPGSVDDATVERSNRIMMQLRRTGRRFPDLVDRISALPMHLLAQVGDARVSIVHGDAWSLAGWEFAHEQLHEPGNVTIQDAFGSSNVDIFASSHTCLPALRQLHHNGKARAIINNGAAGMPNFSAMPFGVATRISVRPCPPSTRLYGTRINSVFVDAVKLHYDQSAFVDEFLSNWPAGSAAHESYYSRIVHGPAHSRDMALGIMPGHCARQRTG
ncbi:MAG: hypothetical protein PVH25_09475 [Burkholderiales bacterium]